MHKPLRSGFVASALLALAGFSATAAADTGPYIGASIGNAEVGLQEADRDNLNLDIRDNDIGYKLYGGFNFILGGVEAGYIDFGAIGGNEANVEITGFNAFGVLSMGIGPAEVFGKIGGFVWESDIEVVQATYDESGFDPAFGLGASFSLGGIGVRAEYEYFDISEFDKVSMLSVGATFSLF